MIRRLIRLLLRFNIFDRHYILKYSGKIISFNQLYSGGHWGKRQGYKNTYGKIFSSLCLAAKIQPMQELFLVVFYNTRHDCDNIVLSAKFLLDVMKGKYITDDSSKYYKGILVHYDSSLPRGVLEFHILGKA
jgi:hypothetical protein